MQLVTNAQQKELKSHGNYAFPVAVSEEVLAHYERGSFLWHWHPEIELTFVTDGEIQYQINEQVYHLRTGEGLFCNSNALHTGHMIDQQDCHYISITFHPKMVYGYEGSTLHQNYVKPLITSTSFSSLHITAETDWHQEMLEDMHAIAELYFARTDLYELKIQQRLSHIWQLLLERHIARRDTDSKANSRDIERLRVILGFLEEHYMEKITLEDIAEEIGLCKAECCRLFKRLMNKSLFDYILYYRVEKSLPLLAQKNLSVTEIAEQTGFSSSSYYARVFKAQLGCSPSQYRSEILRGISAV